MTTTSQVTDVDRERAVIALDKLNIPTEFPAELRREQNIERLASELAAARRDGEIAEHKRDCKWCRRGEFPCGRIQQLEEGR